VGDKGIPSSFARLGLPGSVAPIRRIGMENVTSRRSGGKGDELGSLAIQLFQQLATPAFALDKSCRVLFWNGACERLTGISSFEMLGTRDHWRAFYDSERPCLADLIVQGRTDQLSQLYVEQIRYDASQGSFHCENWCVLQRTGKRLYLGFDSGPIYDSDGQIVAAVEVFRNMTSDKVRQSRLQQLASMDALTGIANRRRFDEALQEAWDRAITDADPISLLMIDIDHFKAYNDTHGHLEGDRCIRAVADVISDHMFRTSNISARYGGEEFAVILPSTPLKGAAALAERIRRALCAVRSRDELFRPITGMVTVSVGVASCIPTLNSDLYGFIACADSALYQAKRAGRNRVVCYDVPNRQIA
jgi:diguanylate cyclase (GGDEF)-like protein